MQKFLKFLASMGFIVILVSGCKKEIDPPPPPPPPPAVVDSGYVESDQYILEPHTVNITYSIQGFYSAVPGHYYKNKVKYPVLIYIHGAGQYGDGSTQQLKLVFNEGTPRLLRDKTFPLNFVSNGQHYQFMVMMPQYLHTPTTTDIKLFYDYVKANYRVDPARIYMSGFSLGGLITSEFGAGYPGSLSAMSPMAGEPSSDLVNKGRQIAQNNLAVWVFHNDGDSLYSVSVAKNFVNAINGQNPSIPAKLTVFPPQGLGNHDAWTRGCDPNYRENGKNVYEWMLGYKR